MSDVKEIAVEDADRAPLREAIAARVVRRPPVRAIKMIANRASFVHNRRVTQLLRSLGKRV